MSEHKTEKHNTEQPAEVQTVAKNATEKEARENTVDNQQAKVQLDQALDSNPNKLDKHVSVTEQMLALDQPKHWNKDNNAQKDNMAARPKEKFEIVDHGHHPALTKESPPGEPSSIGYKPADTSPRPAHEKSHNTQSKLADTASGDNSESQQETPPVVPEVRSINEAQIISSVTPVMGSTGDKASGLLGQNSEFSEAKTRGLPNESILLSQKLPGADVTAGTTQNKLDKSTDKFVKELKQLGILPPSLNSSELATLELDRTRLKHDVLNSVTSLKDVMERVKSDPTVMECDQLREQKEMAKRQLDFVSLPEQKRADRLLAENLLSLGVASDPFIGHTRTLNLSLPDTLEVATRAVEQSSLPQADKDSLQDDLINLRYANTQFPESSNTSTRNMNLDLAEKLREKGIVLPEERWGRNTENPATNIATKEDFNRAEVMIRAQYSGETPDCTKMLERLKRLQEATDDVSAIKTRTSEIDNRLGTLNAAEQRALKPVADQKNEVANRSHELREVEKRIREGSFDADLKIIDQMEFTKRLEIYSSLKMIAKNNGGPPNNLSEQQRMESVRDLAHQIAHPNDIVQSNKETCGLASSEFDLASKYPHRYARYASELLIYGKCATSGGKLAMEPDLMNRGGHQNDAWKGERSLVSAAFQTAAADRFEFLKTGGHYKDNSGIFEVGTARPGFTSGGEEIINANVATTDWKGTNQEVLSKLISELTGEQHKFVPIVVDENSGEQGWKDAESKFMETIKDQEMPINVAVRLRKDDFTGMDSEGGHELSLTLVTGQKPGETMVYFNNTAGGTDHGNGSGAPIPLRDFIKAMQFKDEHRGLIVRVRNK